MNMKLFTRLFTTLTLTSLLNFSTSEVASPELSFLNATNFLREKTLEKIYRSKCAVVHNDLNDKFNDATDVKKILLETESLQLDPYIDIDELTQNCPNGTFVSVSPPTQSNSYQITEKNGNEMLYVDHETRFLIKGSVNLQNIRDMIASPTAYMIPEDSPKVALQVIFRNASNVCGPKSMENSANDIDNAVEFFDLNQTENEQEFVVNYTVTVETPGIYSMFGILEFALVDRSPNSTTLINATAYVVKYWDEAQFLHYYKTPDIRIVSTSARIVAYTMIAIVSSIELTLLILTIKYRDKTIMKMSQGSCLIAFLITGIFVSTNSVFYNPKNARHCNLKGIFLFLPLQLYISIICGRLWRITSIMSPLLNWGQNEDKENALSLKLKQIREQFTLKFDVLREKLKYPPRSRKSVRVTISDTQLWLMICFLIIPQFLTQIVFLATNPQELFIHYNSDRTVGRYQCRSDFSDKGEEHLWWSMAWLFLGLIITLVYANRSRSLPSLFDEAYAVYSSIVIMVIVLLAAISISTFAGKPEINPNLSYLIMVLSTNIMSLVPSYRIMYPKLKLVLSGQDVTMNSLLLEHNKRVREKSTAALKATTKNNGSKRHISNHHMGDENVDLVHTMIDAMNVLKNSNQKNLSGLEITTAEWEDLGNVVSKLNDALQAKNEST